MKILLLCLFIFAASCTKKQEYTCNCVTPYGSKVVYRVDGDYSNARNECSLYQSKWNATGAYVGTMCNLD